MDAGERFRRWITVREGVVDPVRRTRLIAAVAACVLVPAGLSTKAVPSAWVRGYAGDILIALFLAFCVRGLAPRRSAGFVVCAVGIYSVLVEISQCYHAPWIDSLRRTFPGAIVLGTTFQWMDLACYGAGLAVYTVFDRRWRLRAGVT